MSIRTGFATLTAFTIIAALAGCSAQTRLEDLVEARQQSANLLVAFTRAADASNRAVMADTDERSLQFADEARAATEDAQRSADMLKVLLEHAQFTPELEQLRKFQSDFARYRDLDRQILELAVENTNLKAQRLSFGAGMKAADAFRDAVAGLAPRRPADAARLRAAGATAIAAIREVQALEAPHIAEAEDAAMTVLERRIDAGVSVAQAAVAELAALARVRDGDGMAAVSKALADFLAVHAEIIQLSRRNSNVRSLALTLNQKRALTMECEATALALRDDLQTRSLGGFR
jgi:hypothetical protein